MPISNLSGYAKFKLCKSFQRKKNQLTEAGLLPAEDSRSPGEGFFYKILFFDSLFCSRKEIIRSRVK